MICKLCGSAAINHHRHGRNGSKPDLCDVCYWRDEAEKLLSLINRLEETGDALMEIVEGALSKRWNVNGFRLKDTPEWVQFYVSFRKAKRSKCQMEGGQAVSNTPRMDAALKAEQSSYGEAKLLTEGMKLECELNAANERIKRLEEAGARAVLKAHLPDRLAAWEEANPGRVFDWNQIKKEEKP